ncbi:MAG: hypothetical protein ACKOWE_04840 [Micrococcales bacterium]
MSEEFLTRRQMREREQTAASAPEVLPTRRELRDREKAIQDRLEKNLTPSQPIGVIVPESVLPTALATTTAVTETPVVTEFVTQAPFIDEANPGTIPTQVIRREVTTDTASIILPTLPDITGSSFVVPESNIVIHTGAIDVPAQPTTPTGEITLITQPEPVIDASRADYVEPTDTGKIGVLGIEPMPARSLAKRNKDRVFPGRLRKGWGTVYLVLGVALVMAAIGTLVFLLFSANII